MNALVRIVLILLASMVLWLCFCSISNGTTGYYGCEINAAESSARGITCRLAINAISHQMETRTRIKINLKTHTNTKKFTTYSGEHKKSASYKFKGVSCQKILVGNDVHDGPSCTAVLRNDGRYRMVAMSMFIWETSRAKVIAGFPRYYERTVITEPIGVTASDINEIIEGSKNGGDTGSAQKSAAIAGRVGHTAKWDENRERFNQNREEGSRRSKDIFWSGEKFIVSAKIFSRSRLSAVRADIKGTRYGTHLHKHGSTWVGTIFNESMADQWGRKGIDKLVFRFSAVAGGKKINDDVTVYVDDSDEYWKMHRKE